MKRFKGRIKNILANLRNEPIILLKGIYDSWDEASDDCIGYDSDTIWHKVIDAVNKVRSGEAAFERDGFAFTQPHYNYPVVAFLLQLFLEERKLYVLDFGGSLGSMYYQHKDIFSYISDFRWNIVEQKHVVEYGKENLEDDRLLFFYDINDVRECNFIIVGSSLQYLEDYTSYLDKLVKKKVKYILLDRIPVSGNEWISVEIVHEPIYEASYPIRVFKKSKLLHTMRSHGYEAVQTWLPETREQFKVNEEMVTFESFLFVLESE